MQNIAFVQQIIEQVLEPQGVFLDKIPLNVL